MNLIRTVAAVAALAAALPALAQSTTARPGDHPAIVTQRLYAKQGYDYASKFYPHPAWLYLYAEAPKPTRDEAAAMARDAQKQREAPSGAAVPAREVTAVRQN